MAGFASTPILNSHYISGFQAHQFFTYSEDLSINREIMFKKKERRKTSRSEHQAPIIYALQGSYEYHNAVMYNYSLTGMQFLSSSQVCPGADIEIKMVNYCAIFNAEVRWCQEIKGGQKVSFAIGVCYHDAITID